MIWASNGVNVFRCRSDCGMDHEHYQGSYEMAVRYFGMDQDKIRSYGRLINVVLYHQTSCMTVPKLSSELFDILVKAMSEHKYWVEPSNRDERAHDVLDQAERAGLLMDDKILASLERKGTIACNRRKYMHEMWLKNL